jgi:ribosomal protein S18 acetylase RimI-like enzyme
VSEGLSVRAATLGDLPIVVELRLALIREYNEHPFYERVRDDVRERAFELYRSQITSPYERIFLAERERRVVGILRCVEMNASPLLLPERYCYVSSVYVVPSTRQQGVLRAMLDAADRWCEERGIPEMRLNNSTSSAAARGAWHALGFEVVEEVRRRVVRAGDESVNEARTRAGAR